ncbi:hypothetical protein [Ruegeria arenilitoris]|uniref:hypothetical protein n=1 Tax=Ruegeria arenilitoris TaxID=1173585 RepID=UPI0014809E22|nr:hypothetical protein [Ruegeria arenilitoris]
MNSLILVEATKPYGHDPTPFGFGAALDNHVLRSPDQAFSKDSFPMGSFVWKSFAEATLPDETRRWVLEQTCNRASKRSHL